MTSKMVCEHDGCMVIYDGEHCPLCMAEGGMSNKLVEERALRDRWFRAYQCAAEKLLDIRKVLDRGDADESP